MGRPRGSRNPGFDERRSALARAVMGRISTPGGSRASLRELAQAAGVGLPTIRHYFGDRDGLLAAAFAEMRKDGEPWLALGRTAHTDRPLGESCAWFLKLFVVGWQQGVAAGLSQGLAAGMDEARVGPAFVDDLLEPNLQTVEARLAVHQARGELDPDADLRHAALVLLCPVLLALLHQGPLGGSRCRPLVVDRFVDDHVERFVRAWSPREVAY